MKTLDTLRSLRPASPSEPLLAIGFGRRTALFISALSPRRWHRLLVWGEFDEEGKRMLVKLGPRSVRFGPVGAVALATAHWHNVYADLYAVDLDEDQAFRDGRVYLGGRHTPVFVVISDDRTRIEDFIRAIPGPARSLSLEQPEENGPWIGISLHPQNVQQLTTGECRINGSSDVYRAEASLPRMGLWRVKVNGAKLTSNAQGAAPATTEAALWLRLLEGFPAMSSLGGTSIAALATGPNAIRRGPAVLDELAELGFELDQSGRTALARVHKRYRAQTSALAVLSASEILAYMPEGPLEVVKDATIGGCDLKAGSTVVLRRTWRRQEERLGKREYGRGVTVFEIYRNGALLTAVTEADPEVGALLDAFGTPDVPVVSEADAPIAVRERLARLEARFTGLGKELLSYQRQELLRLAQRQRAGLLWEQGCGKTVTAACWAALHGVGSVLVAAPAYLVPVWLEELRAWGFDARELDHSRVDEARTARNPDGPVYWVVSYETLKLTGRYEEWTCDHATRNKERKQAGKEPLAPTVVHGRVCPVCHRRLRRECPRCGAPRGVPVCPVCGNVSTHWRRRDQGFSWTCRHPAHNRRLIAAGQPPVAPTTLSESVCPVCGQSRPDFGHWAQTVESAALAGYAPKSANPKAQYPLYKRVKDAFECVILDEAQTAKSKSSLAGQAARSLRAPLRMLVTGTLIKGYLPDIYYSLGWLLGWDTPQWPFRYGDIRRFLETFGAYERLEGEDGEFGDWKLLPEASNLCALWNLLAPWVSRFKKADVLDLPVKEQHLLYLEMPQEQRELYDQLHAHAYSHLRNALFSEGLDNQARARAVMAALWPLRYAASCPTSAKATWDGIEPLPGGYQSAKVREAMRLVEEIRSKGERVVIFTSLADLLADMGRALGLAGINYCQITARENARERLYLVDKFNHGREPVLLASMGALGHGVTITGANHVVLMNEEWSPELTAQAQDRVHRIGQDKPVHVYQLLCKGTIDEDMHSLNVQKLAAQAAVLDRTPASEQAEQSLRGHEDVRLLLARRIIARLPVSRPKGNRKRVVTVVPSGPVSGVQLRLF